MTLAYPTIPLELAAFFCLLAFIIGAAVGFTAGFMDRAAGKAGKARDA